MNKFKYTETEVYLCIEGDTGSNEYVDVYESVDGVYGVIPNKQDSTLDILKKEGDVFRPIKYGIPIFLIEAIAENNIIYYNEENSKELQIKRVKEYYASKKIIDMNTVEITQATIKPQEDFVIDRDNPEHASWFIKGVRELLTDSDLADREQRYLFYKEIGLVTWQNPGDSDKAFENWKELRNEHS